jgi:hypothetical protein
MDPTGIVEDGKTPLSHREVYARGLSPRAGLVASDEIEN